MKILFIPGENDYDALAFEKCFVGESVKTIIDKHKKGEPLVVTDDDGSEFQMEYRIIEVPDIVISREFVNFIKDDFGDYDSGKHCNFYLETSNVPL